MSDEVVFTIIVGVMAIPIAILGVTVPQSRSKIPPVASSVAIAIILGFLLAYVMKLVSQTIVLYGAITASAISLVLALVFIAQVNQHRKYTLKMSTLKNGGILNMVGRIGFGVVSDRLGNKLSLIIGLILVLISLSWLPVARYAWMLFLFGVIFGLGTGGAPAVIPPIITELFGLKSHGTIMGMTAFSWGIGAAFGPLMAGFIFDSTQSYRIAFIILAILGAVSVILASTLKPIGLQRSTFG